MYMYSPKLLSKLFTLSKSQRHTHIPSKLQVPIRDYMQACTYLVCLFLAVVLAAVEMTNRPTLTQNTLVLKH